MTTTLSVADVLSPSCGVQQEAEHLDGHTETEPGKRSHVEGPRRVTDLVLVVHGIGQGVCIVVRLFIDAIHLFL